MEIDKTLVIAAPREQVWALLLDPQVMAGAVPGMKSIEVISPTEYVAEMHQKISFISAKFKLRTRIVEQRPPEYLRAEGTGEDASVASSLKQRSEIVLEPTEDGGTQLRLKVTVDLLGRLGTFGLSVMKTKADRLWEEFGANLKARIESGDVPSASAAPPTAVKAAGAASPPAAAAPANAGVPPKPQPQVAKAPEPSPVGTASARAPTAQVVSPQVSEQPESPSLWARLFGGARRPAGPEVAYEARTIRVEVRQIDRTISVEWPVESADQCREWLRELTARGAGG